MSRYFRTGFLSHLVCSATLLLAASLAVRPASAAPKLRTLRVVKAVAFAWTFTPLDVGIKEGIFAKHGLKIEETATQGDAKVQQLLASDSVDLGIGSGPGMAFAAKGSPVKAVAEMYGPPRNIAVMVGYDSPIKTVAELKGAKLGCTTVGSLTYWIGQRINEKEGWGKHGITMVPIGGEVPARAAIRTHQIDGYIGALEQGYKLQAAKEWRVITPSTPFVKHFITHVIFARNALIKKHPELVRKFLAGWFDTIAFMKKHKKTTVAISSKVIGISPAIGSRVYDQQIGGFSTNGVFDSRALATLRKSFIQMGILKKVPADNVLFTTQFVPVKVGG
jgi:ABC-type nitrate/sulfonate/bicarbonate transport system substrate-binding protein